MNPSKIKTWILASRPKTLWASIAPILIGTAMAFSDDSMQLTTAFIILIAALLIQVGTNFANDYFDYIHGVDSKERIGPLRVTQAGLIKPEMMKLAFISVFSLSFFIGLYLVWLGGWPILAIGIISILSGILYTGGPYPFGYYGLGDIVVLIFFGPVAVGGTYYLQTFNLNFSVIFSGFAPGLFSMAILTVNNLRDIHTDRQAGKKTLAVRFGATFARREYLFTIILACIIPAILLLFDSNHPYSVATILVFLFAFSSIKTVFNDKIGPHLNQVLAHTGKALFLYSVIFSIGWNI